LRAALTAIILHMSRASPPVVNGVSAGAEARELYGHDAVELAGGKIEFYLLSA